MQRFRIVVRSIAIGAGLAASLVAMLDVPTKRLTHEPAA